MKRFVTLAAAALVGAALIGPARAAADGPKRKNIDIVICLDISGSMSGLLNGGRPAYPTPNSSLPIQHHLFPSAAQADQ